MNTASGIPVGDEWLAAVRTATGSERRALLEELAAVIPAGYDELNAPEVAAVDVGAIAELLDSGAAITTRLLAGDDVRLRVYLRGTSLALADLLPMMEQLGLRALDERAFAIDLPGDRHVSLHDVRVTLPSGVAMDEELSQAVQQAFVAEYDGSVETDGLNRLVLLARLRAAQVKVLRAYVRYLQQIGFPFAQASIEQTLARHPGIAAALVALFEARFDPTLGAADDATRIERVAAVGGELATALDAVPGIDDDRTLRAIHALVEATTRTNVFRRDGEGAPRPVVAFKFDTSKVPDLPLPRPMFEIWVFSPRVEGVHLRNGRIARGGIRWSDRREDFRTEVLGLVKAQIVKNAVIVPTGAKGGFVVKKPPAAGTDEFRAEGVACYRLFIAGLLDLTDNIVDAAVVPPPDTVRYDADDPYLVVAADKGTATFSDIANALSADYGFWLGDAFASGGSVGYDHKAMGITARGAWESVRRHARSIAKDADRDPLTVVGIGDMSGDVFGNGLLRSANLRLVAAFDHRHIFLDPDPDPAASFAERQRLFALPRSSWADYDAKVLSPGGGVYPRTQKTIEISPAAAKRLGVDGTSFTPATLMSAILRAPVDLLWNGGIGTYVKASTETHADVGDRANDALRVDGNELRCAMVGEGGNLGFTQRGRVEFALNGGLVNTDAIDNSAGVDCSDHEVNLKILLAPLVASGVLTADGRDRLLADMTDEVAELVLDDNRAQTLALTIARRQAHPMVNVHARYLHALEAEGWLNRSLEFLPTDRQLAERQTNGQGLTTPEFAVVLAYTKSANYAEMMRSDLPDDPYLLPDLVRYFPAAVRSRFGAHIRSHRLAREIIGTQIVNQMTNLSGLSFDHRVSEDTGAGVVDVLRAWIAARDIFGFATLWDEVDALTSDVRPDTQMELFLECRRMVERGVLWLMRHRRPPIALAQVVGEFRQPIGVLATSLEGLLAGRLRDGVFAAEASRLAAGVPEGLAQRSVVWPLLHTGFDIVELSSVRGLPIDTVGATYWQMFEHLDLGWLWDAVGALPRADRWQTQVRASLRDDLMGALAGLADDALHQGGVEGWAATNDKLVTRAGAMLTEIRRAGSFDVTTVSVAVRQLRNLSLVAYRPT